jgi:hypothetical protein
MRKKFIKLLCAFLLVSNCNVFAEKMDVPADLQVAFFIKVLPYDRNLRDQSGSEIKIGIVFIQGDGDSEKAKDEIIKALDALAEKVVADLPISYITIPFSSKDQLNGAVREQKINTLYITPGASKILKDIIRVSRINKAITLTGVEDYVEKGISVGIGLKGDKPQIVINLPSSKREGRDFDAGLLKISKVIKEEVEL